MKKWLIASLALLGAIGEPAWAQTTTKKTTPKVKAAPKAPAKTPAKTAEEPTVEVDPSAADDAAAKASVPGTPTDIDQGPISDPNIPDNLITRRPRDEGPATPVTRFTKSDYPDE